MKTTTTLASFLAQTAFLSARANPLPSWNDTAPKAIIEFVEEVTKEARQTSCQSRNASRSSTTMAQEQPHVFSGFTPVNPYQTERVTKGGSFLCSESYCASDPELVSNGWPGPATGPAV